MYKFYEFATEKQIEDMKKEHQKEYKWKTEDMNEKDIINLLSDLRKEKQKGYLDTDIKCENQNDKWRNTIEYSKLDAFIVFYSEKCRLETLALIVESRKSTLCFTHWELNMILLFLKCNICEKMEYLPFIKKALKRFKDSLAVMQRQLAQEIKMRKRHEKYSTTSETYENDLAESYQRSNQIEINIKVYETFFIILHEFCVNNLYPDAVYQRRRSSLQILLFTNDLFCNEYKSIEWKKEEAEIIFKCLLLDSYESNKEMAYEILKSMNPIVLCLDLNSQVQSIIKVALGLGNSLRPIDSVTATYMLKICKLSPIIKDVLRDYSNIEDNSTESVTLQLILLLYTKLQESFTLAKQNICMAIVKGSLYGYLFCIRNLLSECDLKNVKMDKLWQNTIADIILLCFELNGAVSVIINNSSPEGHLPMDLKVLDFNDDPFSDKEIITPQKVLLCSWRTVKEVSQLFGLLATKASIQTNEVASGLLSGEQIENIMQHLVSLLCETKHRGAFEQVYVGFQQLCTRLWQLTDTTLQTLPAYWLHSTLLSIVGLTPGYSKLCATRRSAGVPFLIQAILSSEPPLHDNMRLSCFHSVMEILLKFAKLEDTDNWHNIIYVLYENTVFSKYQNSIEQLIQNEYGEIKPNITEIKIHSLNILRALFRHSQLGELVRDYIADGLMIALTNYDCKTWAERNAATLLFSALIVRIFGVQRTKDHINLRTTNRMSGRVFFERYPSLIDFMLHELQLFILNNHTSIKSNVQAILLLLSRLDVSHDILNVPDLFWEVSEFVSLISQCAISPVYEIRELAARTLVTLLTGDTAYSIIRKIFMTLDTLPQNRISRNLIHGYLLQLLEIMRKKPSVNALVISFSIVSDALQNMAKWVLDGLERGTDNLSCFPIATVYVDILYELFKKDHNTTLKYDMNYLHHTVTRHLVTKNLLKQEPGEQMYKTSLLRFTSRRTNNNYFLLLAQHIVITENNEMQYILWTNMAKDIQNICHTQDAMKPIYNHFIHIATNLLEDLYKYNPKIQDAVFDFLYNSLMYIDLLYQYQKHERVKLLILICKKVYLRKITKLYSQRKNYLRLLGKCMVESIYPQWNTLRNIYDEENEIKPTFDSCKEHENYEKEENIYAEICDHNWIGSLDDEVFRLSVFDILHDLYVGYDEYYEKYSFDYDDCSMNSLYHKKCYIIADWWTMLLQLLVNDNADIRLNASAMLCQVKPVSQLKCIDRMLPLFFQKFEISVAGSCPAIAICALFSWSISLLGDTDYEMDETDVFNKCKNYDVFEPVQISYMCFDLAKWIMQQYSIDKTLCSHSVKWINKRLDTNFSFTSSFRDIINSYKNSDNMPTLGKGLDEILDPTYKDKLLQISACEKYMSL